MPAGGGVDTVTRIFAAGLQQHLGQPFVIENRGGAGGNIGAETVYAAEPDGYTLLASQPAPITSNIALYKKLNFDPAALESVAVVDQIVHGSGGRRRVRVKVASPAFPLSTWLAAPHVATWWREDPALEAVESRYGPCIDGVDPTEVFIVELEGRPAGLVQRYLLDDYPSWAAALDMSHAAGIDYLIGVEELTGTGLGGRIIDVFTDLTFDRYPDIDKLAVAVQQANRPSWRSLEKAGFTRVFAGTIESTDPSDEGPGYIYVRLRQAGGPTTVSAP